MDALTKSCFENGLSATEWLAVLHAGMNHASLTNTAALSLPIAEALFDLLVIWPANQTVIEYLDAILKSHLLPLHIFTPAFLRATRKSEFTDSRSVDMLCQLTISTARDMPMDVLISLVDPIEPVSATLFDGCNLLRGALNLPYSTLHDLQASASQVLLLLLQYNRTILPHLSTQETLQILGIVHEILQHPSLNPDLIHSLENTNRLIGEILAVTDTLSSVHPEILGMGLPAQDLTTVETSDLVSCSLLLRHLVDYRTHPYGCGNTDHALSMLVGLFKWTGSPLSTFCAELIQASVISYLESFQLRLADPLGALVWSSFVYGRLPTLLQKLVDTSAPAQHQSIFQPAIVTSYEKLSGQLEFAMGFQAAIELDDPVSANQNPAAFPLKFLHSLVAHSLLAPSTAKQIRNEWVEENKPPAPLLSEMGDSSITEMIESLTESDSAEQGRIFDLLVADPTQQESFSEAFLTKFAELSTSSDFLSLSTLCEGLMSHSSVLDIMALYISITQLLQSCLRFLDNLDWENIEDPQTAIAPFGSIVMFLQSAIGRYKITPATLRAKDRSLSADYLMQAGSIELSANLEDYERNAYQNWYKALFDPSSDGIDDALVRSTNPKLLLKLSPVLISEAIAACRENATRSTELDSLRNGINYFQEPLLSWTLVGVVRSVALQMERNGQHAPIHAEVLQKLLKDAPANLLKMVNRTLARVLALDVDAETMGARQEILNIIGTTLKPQNGQRTLATYSHKLAPGDLIRATFMSIRSNRAVSLDVPLCLQVMRPAEFLMHLHRELYTASQLGETESSRRIAVYALSQGAQSSPDQPWLLPLYTTFYVPRILSSLGPQDSLLIESMAAAISSSFRLCLALDRANPTAGPEPSLIICQRFAQILKKMMGHGTVNGATIMWKSIQAIQAFTAQFPYFA